MKIGIRSDNSRKRGFSLVEVLVVIAVIAVIAAIAVPTITRLLDKSEDTTTRRNAQIVAATAGQAQHAGNETIAAAPSKEAAVALVAAGVSGTGSMSHLNFRLALSDKEQTKVLDHLNFQGGLLTVVSP